MALKAKIRVTGDRVATVEIEAGHPFVIGRSKQASLQLDDLRVSRRHCSLDVDASGVLLTDHDSANGTFLNKTRIRRAFIRTGDKLTVGNTELVVRVELESAVSPVAAACEICRRAITAATVAEGDAIAFEDRLVCPQCREKLATTPHTVAELRAIETLKGDGFEVLERISGRGRVPVFLARRGTSPVAIKLLPLDRGFSSKKVRRFVKEAEAAARLDHPRVVKLLDVRHRDEIVYIAMEFVEGRTLDAEIERVGRMAVKEVLRLAYQLADALSHVHRQGIAHRDVKPHNIMVTPQGDVKLIDFGIAKDLWSDIAGASLTGSGETLGTFGYMAPEQLENAKASDARSDIYGLGATLHHALSGRAPAVPAGLLPPRSIAPPPLEALTGVPIAVARMIGKMTMTRPEERHGTMDDVRAEIDLIASALMGVGDLRGSTDFFLRLREESIDVVDTARLPSMSALLGSFTSQDLINFFQVIEFNQKTGTIEISGDVWRGKIHVSSGRIFAAESWHQSLMKGESCSTVPMLRGEPAVLALLSLGKGDFEFVPAVDEEPTHECDLSITGILVKALGAADARDETARR